MDMKKKRKNTEILNYFIMVINVRAGHGHCSPVFNKNLLIQQRRFEFIMQFFSSITRLPPQPKTGKANSHL